MLYVTMTDKFMSGWGSAHNKTNKLVFECENMEQALIVENNAKLRGDMKYININVNKPRYNNQRYYTQFKTIEDYPNWYVPNYFKKQA